MFKYISDFKGYKLVSVLKFQDMNYFLNLLQTVNISYVPNFTNNHEFTETFCFSLIWKIPLPSHEVRLRALYI